jgi:hypothetical protein
MLHDIASSSKIKRPDSDAALILILRGNQECVELYHRILLYRRLFTFICATSSGRMEGQITTKQICGFCLGIEKIICEKRYYSYSSINIAMVQMELHSALTSERLNSNLVSIGKSKSL